MIAANCARHDPKARDAVRSLAFAQWSSTVFVDTAMMARLKAQFTPHIIDPATGSESLAFETNPFVMDAGSGTQSPQSSYSFLNSNPGGSVVLSSTPTIDTSLNRAYFETSDTPNVEASNRESTLQGFNLTTQAPTWIARFPTAQGRLIRWGANGLAFVGGSAGSLNVTLISGSLISR